MPVTGAGDLIEYTPGDGVAVEVTADSTGTVATRGVGVALTGENEVLTEVSRVQTDGEGVGFLARDPSEFTGNQGDYSAGESAGRCEVISYIPIVLLDAVDDFDTGATGTQTPAVGDEVEFKANGIVGPYASADTPYGVVWRTFGDGAAPSKIQIAVYR